MLALVVAFACLSEKSALKRAVVRHVAEAVRR